MAQAYVFRASSKKDKDFAEKENFVQEGTMEVIPNVGYRPNDVYRVIGTGAVFDGNYRVKKVTHKFNLTDGLTTSLEVEKTVSNGVPQEKSDVDRPTGNTTNKAEKVYTVTRGDTAWNISERFCKSATAYREWYPYNGKQPVVQGNTKYWYVSVGEVYKIPGHLLK
ncbi:hypothetical protein F400_gp085 [Bacillus phage BCD7]|uniref:LysM domain-containing protein n=1 Tax=Bacillus phage BCD7 TaxID=1136534 RepID=J9PUD7_9CAUD|nr:hypothetical protein F400_gp085 [Bacillus phage BCD7]AEZ50532.1 hypothetical protein BCD7_0085 [Bacillus phage BCD7]